MAQEKEMNADGHLEKLLETPSVEGYVVFNSDGIPMRYDSKLINHKRAVHIASLFSDYFRVCKKIISEDLKPFLPNGGVISNKRDHREYSNNEHELELIRLKTQTNREFILTYHGEFFIVCIQNFNEQVVVDNGSEDENEKELDEYGLAGMV